MVSGGFDRKKAGAQSPKNCYRRGMLAAEAANALSQLSHELEENDRAAAKDAMDRAEAALDRLEGVVSKKDVRPVMQVVEGIRMLRGLTRRKASKLVKTNVTTILATKMDIVRRRLAKSCDA